MRQDSTKPRLTIEKQQSPSAAMVTLTHPPSPEEREDIQNISSGSTVVSDDEIIIGGSETSQVGCCKQQPISATLTRYANQAIIEEEDCNAMLDTLDSCVACAEGVDLQTQYEDKIDVSFTATETTHSLTEKEAALIRLQIMEENKKRSRSSKRDMASEMLENGKRGKPYDNMMDAYNFCGFDESIQSPWECQSPKGKNQKNSSISHTESSDTQSQTGHTSSLPSLCGFGNDPHDQELIHSFSQVTIKMNNAQKEKPKSTNKEHCAVCFDQPHQREVESDLLRSFASMPCCGKDGSENIKICTACILLLCAPTTDGDRRVGRCPHCKAWIKVVSRDKKVDESSYPSYESCDVELNQSQSFNLSDILILQVEEPGQCSVCNQVKDYLVDSDNVCDACYLGRRQPLLYECEQCHNSQRIPHPMYRYQPAMDEFSRTSWTCQATCKNFTKWRILPDQLNFIPVGDSPLEWGENNLEIARIRVMDARRGIVAMQSKRIVNETPQSDMCTIS